MILDRKDRIKTTRVESERRAELWKSRSNSPESWAKDLLGKEDQGKQLAPAREAMSDARVSLSSFLFLTARAIKSQRPLTWWPICLFRFSSSFNRIRIVSLINLDGQQPNPYCCISQSVGTSSLRLSLPGLVVDWPENSTREQEERETHRKKGTKNPK